MQPAAWYPSQRSGVTFIHPHERVHQQLAQVEDKKEVAIQGNNQCIRKQCGAGNFRCSFFVISRSFYQVSPRDAVTASYQMVADTGV
ncbi:hypothetical protein L1987_06586 [Smallanthus sonchifolius]|uniref:Uncharacterized protein n=1 Tax=Smallanthus sonchifolius TaxID=185202 RepID=A0ACB9JYS7_9ASTR|nr:hypothetical protein L1987_06586 [Smallanthus sonchifolius]